MAYYSRGHAAMHEDLVFCIWMYWNEVLYHVLYCAHLSCIQLWADTWAVSYCCILLYSKDVRLYTASASLQTLACRRLAVHTFDHLT